MIGKRTVERLRIAVDARSLLCAQPRGEGKSLLRLYQEIVALRPDIAPVFFGDAAAARYRGVLPAGVRVVSTARIGDRFNAWEDAFLPLAARWAGCRLMHCTSSGSPRRCGLPMVMTVHDLIPLVFDDGHNAAERAHFCARLMRGLRQAQQVMTVSAHTRDDLLRVFPAAADHVEVVHWGADRAPSAASHLPAVVGGEPPTVLVFGGEAPRKNTSFTVERFIAAARRQPALRLCIVGVNAERQRAALARRFAEAGLADRVQMPGFVDEDTLARLLSPSSLLLYLSLYEGFGLPVLEAIGRGMPVIAAARTSLPELLAGVPGCMSLDEPGAIDDLIVALSSDGAARAAHARAQSSVLAKFSWSFAAQRVIETFDDALSAPRRKQAAAPAIACSIGLTK